MIEFYLPGLPQNTTMPETESGHAIRVLRMRQGDTLIAVDGRGNRYDCRILDPHPKHVELEVINASAEEKHWKGRITLAVAPTKNMDRMEWMAEKAVEMGVDEIVLLECRHSERKVVKTDRLLKIMVSAMKQSLKAHLPVLGEMTRLKDWVAENHEGQKFVGYCDERTERVDFSNAYNPSQDVTILIGPEGDFSPEEIKMLFDHGFTAVTFGATRLRTETAAMYAVAAAHALKNEADAS